jgi:hypothetical protein
MYYFNAVAAGRRPVQRSRARTNILILIEGYKAAVERGRAAATAAQLKLQLLLAKKLANEAAVGQTGVDAMLAARR